MGAEQLEQLHDLLAVGEVADLDLERAEQVTEFDEALLVGIVVHAVKRDELVRAREAGDRLVGGEHELLDQLMAFVVLDLFEAVGVALGVDEAADDPAAKQLEIERELDSLASPFRTAEATAQDIIDPADTRDLLVEFVHDAQRVLATQLTVPGMPYLP